MPAPTATPTTGPVRLARAAALAVCALGLAAVAHVVGGGELPALPGLAFLAALTTAAVLVVTMTRLRAGALLVTLGALQVVLHEGLLLLAPGGDAVVLAHDHHHAVVALLDPVAPAAGCGPLMLLAHAAATVATALLLARGEDLLWLAAAVVAPLVALAVAAARALRPRHRPAPMPVAAPRLVSRRWAVASPLRGPPAVA